MMKRNKRRELSVPEQHQLKIARQTLKMHRAVAAVMAGRIMRKRGKYNPKRRKNPGVRIVHNKLLGGWFIVRGPHQTPIGGRFNSKAEAQAHLRNQQAARDAIPEKIYGGMRGKNPVTLKNFGTMTAKQLNGLLKSFPTSVAIKRGELMITATTKGGTVMLSAARVGPGFFHVRAPVGLIDRKGNPIKWLGKFEGEMYAGRYAYENVDDELGDVQDFGWYGNFSRKIKGCGPFHIIVRENSQGFVYGEFFDTEAAMRKAWSRLERDYEKFSEESGEE